MEKRHAQRKPRHTASHKRGRQAPRKPRQTASHKRGRQAQPPTHDKPRVEQRERQDSPDKRPDSHRADRQGGAGSAGSSRRLREPGDRRRGITHLHDPPPPEGIAAAARRAASPAPDTQQSPLSSDRQGAYAGLSATRRATSALYAPIRRTRRQDFECREQANKGMCQSS